MSLNNKTVHNAKQFLKKGGRGLCPCIYQELKYMLNKNLIQMTNFSPPFQKSMPTYLYVMFMAALTTNNFLWESLVGGNLHQQIGWPYVL